LQAAIITKLGELGYIGRLLRVFIWVYDQNTDGYNLTHYFLTPTFSHAKLKIIIAKRERRVSTIDRRS